MTSEVWVGLLSFLGMVIGSVSGIVISAKLTNYRLSQLEKKVEKHNCLVERVAIAENDIKTIAARLSGLTSI